MSTTSNIQPNTQFTGIVDQKKFDNSGTTAPGAPQQQRFENTGFDTTATTAQQQQQQQQPGYLQQAYDGVSSMLGSAASTLPGSTTTATGTETRSGAGVTPALHAAAQRVKQHHAPTGGVGSLPGTPNEEDVVRLPEERQHPDPLAEERERAMHPPAGSRLDDATQQASYAAAAPAGAGVAHPHTTGGSAIGSNFDHHHGLGMEQQKKVGEEVSPLGAGIGGTGTRHPDQPGLGATTAMHNTSTTHPSHPTRDVDTSGTHGVTHAGIHPRDAPGAGSTTATHGMERPKEAVKDTVHRTTGTGDHHPATGSNDVARDTDDTTSPTSGTQKASFMDKMKGQAKVITGKMTKDTEKVEEGKALKSAH